MAIQIKREEQTGTVVLSVQGTIDIYSSPELRGQLKSALEKQSPRIVVDMAGVSFVDSSGLATLIEALQRTHGYGGKLYLCALSTAVLGVFQLANLDNIFQIRKSREEALAS
ncbi:MAG: STAS domain-containing protein [Planctomycetes bacterium]|nr:STAS domain-containing protein [Planctomycetota bacterium]